MDGRKSWRFWAYLPFTPVHIGAVLRRGLASFTGEATENHGSSQPRAYTSWVPALRSIMTELSGAGANQAL